MDAFHERLAHVALHAASDLGFALAGGYAVQAHGFLTRPSEDVDLFTSAERTDRRRRGRGESGKVELAADIRSQAPVTMSIGPVVHVDDVAGGKMEALFTRAEARDFIDIDAMVISGGFTRTKLQELAASRDAGFDLRVLADMLAVIDFYPDAEFSGYGLQYEQIQQMRVRFADWRSELLQQPGPNGA